MTPQQVRAARPLVHAITNYVTMDWVARGLLAAGARPVMARDGSEAAAMAAGADALLLNLGTWSPELMRAMVAAGRAANERGIPVVLDPVGAGALPTRTEAALELLASVKVAAIRGNAGELLALAGETGHVRGVDSTAAATAALVKKVAKKYATVAIATGEVDVLSDGTRTLEVKSGHKLMAQVPGMGCLASGLVAAALAAAAAQSAGEAPSLAAARPAADAPLDTAAAALLWSGLAGELSAEDADGPGTFPAAYLDCLAALDHLPKAARIAPPLAERLAVYVIVSGETPLPTLEAALKAGVGAVQFREKHLPFTNQIRIATAMRDACHRHGALFLINDRVDLALAVNADGVHLGQDDIPVEVARQLLGQNAIIGGTCETEAEAKAATEQGADYIGTGPVYATPSKADAGAPYGPAIAGRISRATQLPVVGIGGIGPGTAAPVITEGACGVAVISSVVNAADPGDAARRLLAEVSTAKENR